MGDTTLERIALSGESFIATIRRAARLAALGALAVFAAGCSTEDSEGAAVSQRQQSAVIGTVTVRIVSGDIKDATPTANAFLDLRDRSSIKSASGTPLPLYNFGNVSTQVGAQVTSGSITSVASVLLRNQTVVQGNVTSGGSITTQAGVTVTGQKLQNQSIPAPVEVSWEVPLAANPGNPKTVNTNGTLTLAPGAYGKLTAYAGAKVNLSSGTYAFSDLQVEPNAALRFTVTPANGPVVLYVDKVTWMRGKIESTVPSIPTSKSVLFVHRGTTNVRFETSANMAIVSPTSRIELATGGTLYQGSVFARGLLLEPDVKLTYVPFEYWDWILPPRPTVSCVMPSGRGKYVAAFGYQNGRPTALQVPSGPENYLDPNTPGPYGPIAPPTTFEPGSHERVLWAPLGSNGMSRWFIMGRSAEATLAAPRCEFAGADPQTVTTVLSEGRTLPRASVPSVPAPRRSPLVLKNALGPGRFHTQQAVPLPPPAPGTPAPVSDPNLPAPSGVAPDIPTGLVTTPITKVRLDVSTTLGADGWPEAIDLRVNSNLTNPPDVEVAVPSTNLVATQSLEREFPGTGSVFVRHQQVEYNDISDHESSLLEVTVDPIAGTFSGFLESGKIAKTWVFPFPFSISNYEALDTLPIVGTVGVPLQPFAFHGSNTATYTISTFVPSMATTRICANWTAYFVDEGLPHAGGHVESFTGTSLDGGLRVRGYPASFARYDLSVKGLFGSLREEGRLDRDGCTADIPALVLQYDETVTDGSAGGVVLHMKLVADFVRPGPSGDAIMPVVVQDPSGVEVYATKTIHLTDFADEPGWVSSSGGLSPPAITNLASEYRDHGTTIAATLSHFLRRLDDLEFEMPAGYYPVNTFGTTPGSTKDYLGNRVVETGVHPVTLITTIGPAFFPCGDPQSSPTDCRQACADDDQCPGGQHCAKEGDPADGCEGGACFCAWADQGTAKYVTTHELGHLVQNAFTGEYPFGGHYTFACPPDPTGNNTPCPELGRLDEDGSTVFPYLLVDPPLMDPVCGCSHVGLGATHCLQSIEHIARANAEGFGHFFASLMWNEPTTSQACVFNYYKEVLDEGPASCRVVDGNGNPDPQACQSFALPDQTLGTVTLPPMGIDCASPVKWRNKNRCGVDAQVQVLQKSSMGTEMDWMTFLYAVQKQVGFTQLLHIHNYACHPEIPFDPSDPGDTRMVRCNVDPARPIAWVDGPLGGFPGENGSVIEPVPHGGFLSGAERKWGPNDLENRPGLILQAGNTHGVSDNTSP